MSALSREGQASVTSLPFPTVTGLTERRSWVKKRFALLLWVRIVSHSVSF